MKCVLCKYSAPQCTCPLTDFRESNRITEAYIELYSEIASKDTYHSLQTAQELDIKAREDFNRISNFAKKIGKPLNLVRVLEVGPGLGHLSKLLIKEGYIYAATDIVPTYLLGMNCTKFLSNVEKLPKFEEKYDIVIACDVFEHVLNEADAIISVAQNLLKGGFLYVRSPYCEPLINYSQILGAPFPFVHLRTYTRRSLRNLMYSGGLSKVRTGLQARRMVSFARRSYLMKPEQFSRIREEIVRGYRSESSGLPKYKGLFRVWNFIEIKLFRLFIEVIKSKLATNLYSLIYYRKTEVWSVSFNVKDYWEK